MNDGDNRTDDDATLTGSEVERREGRKRRSVRQRSSRLGSLASFFELSDRLLGEIEAVVAERRYESGEFLMRQGDRGDCLAVVREGEVEVRVALDDGETHVLKRAGPGDIFGEMALLTREPRTASVVAITPVRALLLPAEEFHRLARAEPALAEVLSRLTARRLGRGSLDALSGKIFEGYRIRRRLGRGGTAVVYEAVESDSGTRVALKMMSHRLVFDEEARKSFQAEADLIESFDHPNIARMIGRFEAFHTFFIVMEYCDGLSLDRVLARRPLAVNAVRRIVGQLAAALAYAHRHRVVHRDIKPSNVMLNRDGIVKLMDFGLALSLSEHPADAAHVAGTPPYMAPEQLEGHPPGTPADLYALAGLTWEMLAGGSLFDAESFRELRKAHRSWRIPDVSTLGPEVPRDLREFLARCLVANPDKRRADLQTMARWAGPVNLDDVAGR